MPSRCPQPGRRARAGAAIADLGQCPRGNRPTERDAGGRVKAEVFLCYAWEDKQQADALRKAMETAGLSVFQDDAGMRDFDVIDARIDEALRRCLVLVALYTPAFPASPYCRKELHLSLL